MWGKPRQPTVLDEDMRCVRGVARKPHAQLVAEPKRAVVVTLVVNGMDREIGPFGKLRGYESPN
jgi:hypothetical protein